MDLEIMFSHGYDVRYDLKEIATKHTMRNSLVTIPKVSVGGGISLFIEAQL